MTVGINQIQPQASPLDKIATAVQIYRNIKGIGTDSDEAEKNAIERKILQTQLDRQQKNIITSHDLIDKAANYNVSPVPSPGSLSFNLQKGDQLEPIYLTPRDKKAGDADKDLRNVAMELRKERNALPITKATQEVTNAYSRMVNASDSPAGDITLVYGLMKLEDPQSSIKEGEYEQAAKATGISDKLKNAAWQLKTGAKLTPQQRAEFLAESGQLYQTQINQQNKVDAGFTQLANTYGVDPKSILLDFSAPANTIAKGKRKTLLPPEPKRGESPSILSQVKGMFTGKSAVAAPPKPEPADLEALKWLKANPNDPNAPQVAAKLKSKGIQ